MGTFNYTFSFGPKDGSALEEVEGLVDTGSAYTVVPAPLLQRLGIVPQWSAFFELADGRREEYGMSEVRAVLDGEERTTICIFGTPDCQALLGAYTLEGFGLAADPVNGRLVPSSLFLI